MDEAALIWNRAAFNHGSRSPEAGDTALDTALTFHGLAMSGGVLDAFERTSEDVPQIQAAFRWLGLESIAELLASVQQDIAVGALNDDDRAEALELEADERYNAILPSDTVLEAAFRVRLKQDLNAFAGLHDDA